MAFALSLAKVAQKERNEDDSLMIRRPCIIDMDGTIYRGDCPLPFADAFLEKLEADGVPFLLMTNNPSLSPRELTQKLSAMGICVQASQIITSGDVAAEYLAKNGAASAFVIGSPSLKALLRSRNIRLDASRPEYVLIGHNQSFTYQDLARAANDILAGSEFVCTDLDHAIPSGDHILPHTGAIAAYLQTVTGRAPRSTGKPERYFLDTACARLHCRPEDLLVIGDNLDTDIEMGRRYGTATALVLTGLTDLERLKTSAVHPTYVLKNLGELISGSY